MAFKTLYEVQWVNYPNAFIEEVLEVNLYQLDYVLNMFLQYINIQTKIPKGDLKEWMEDIKPCLSKLIKNHRKYKKFLRYYLKDYKQSGQSFQMKTFCKLVREMLLFVLPLEWFGNKNYRNKFLANVLWCLKRPLGYSWAFKFDLISHNNCDIGWLTNVPESHKLELYYKSCSFLLLFYVIPLLSSKFYRTCGSKFADTPIYFKKEEFYNNQDNAFKKYISDGYLQIVGINKMEKSPNNANIFFLPKPLNIKHDKATRRGDIQIDITNYRPIIKFKRKGNKINLSKLKFLIGKIPRQSVMPSSKILKQALLKIQKWPSSWMIQCDIQNAYGSINIDLVFTYLKEICNKDEVLFKKIKEDFDDINIIYKNRKCRPSKGLPQGWPFSPALCDLYLIYWENDYVKPILENNNFYLFRYIDDILLITSQLHIATKFLEKINNSFRGISFSHEKLVNNLNNNIEYIRYVKYKINISNWTIMPLKPEFIKAKDIISKRPTLKDIFTFKDYNRINLQEIKKTFIKRVNLIKVDPIFYNISLNGEKQVYINIAVNMFIISCRIRVILEMLEAYGKLDEKFIKSTLVRFCYKLGKKMIFNEPLMNIFGHVPIMLSRFLGRFLSICLTIRLKEKFTNLENELILNCDKLCL